jgi:PAS domain S-box-containing protein
MRAVASDDAIATLRAVLDTSDDAIIGYDADGRIASWNHSAERVFGHPEHEIVGTASGALFPDHLRAEAQLVLETALAGNRVQHFETEMQRRDGMLVSVSLSLCPVPASAPPQSCIAVVRDITEQRLAQATLAEIEARTRRSEAMARVGSWLWDIQSDSVQWSEELHRINGVDPLEFAGTLEAHLAPLHDDDREVVRDAIAKSVATAHSFEAEYRLALATGEERRVYASAEPMFDSAGAVLGLRGIVQDVTQRHPT